MPWVKMPGSVVTKRGHLYCLKCADALQHVHGVDDCRFNYGNNHNSECDRCGVSEQTMHANAPTVHVPCVGTLPWEQAG